MVRTLIKDVHCWGELILFKVEQICQLGWTKYMKLMVNIFKLQWPIIIYMKNFQFQRYKLTLKSRRANTCRFTMDGCVDIKPVIIIIIINQTLWRRNFFQTYSVE